MKNKKLWVFVSVIILMGLVHFISSGLNAPQENFGFGNTTEEATSDGLRVWSYSQLMQASEEKSIKAVVLQNYTLKGQTTKGVGFLVNLPLDARVSEILSNNGADVRVQPKQQPSILYTILISWGPMILLIGVWIFIMKRMQGGMGRAGGFGKSKALLHQPSDKKKVTFDDVAGVDEAKAELAEIVDFLKNPSKFQSLGGTIPKGVLLVGPPGTGKTLIARAIAGEANVPFYTTSGSDFVEMFVGVGASRVRDMFLEGKKNSPCIIFIDEIDAMGRHRGTGIGGGNDEREQTLNAMLVEMDGFVTNDGVILIAATNRPDVLDPALLRPGRFDRQVTIPNPDLLGRDDILKVHMAKLPLGKNVDRRVIARGTPGFSGAELKNLCNEAALTAARVGSKVVNAEHFETAKDRLLMGNERRSLIMSEQEKRLTAYHEAGHALLSMDDLSSDPIHKATIIPRGRALGLVMRLPESDRVSLPLKKIKADIYVGCGGRVAEEVIFGEDMVTTGASGDIRMMTNLSYSMVSEWGFSKELGTIDYTDGQQEPFLGHSLGNQSRVSQETKRIIEKEAKKQVDEQMDRAFKTIREKINILHAIAQALLEKETLNGEELWTIYRGETIPVTIEPTHSETPPAQMVLPLPGEGASELPA